MAVERYYVMRHGASESNVAGIVQGVMDVPLAPLGIRQGRLAGQQLKDEGITHIFASPLIRAKHTAELVAESLDLPVVEEPGLAARNLGEWAGKPRSEIKAMWADLSHPFRNDLDFAPPGGESLNDVEKRLFAAVEHWLQTLNGVPLFVMHLVGTGALVAQINGERPPFKNTEVWQLNPAAKQANPVFAPTDALLMGHE